MGLQVLLGVLATAVLSMPVYVLTGASRRPDALASDAQGTFVLGPFVRSWFYWAVGPVVRASLAIGLGPTFYNLLGVAFRYRRRRGVRIGPCDLGGMGRSSGWRGGRSGRPGRTGRGARRPYRCLSRFYARPFCRSRGLCRAGRTVSVFLALAGSGRHRDGRVAPGQLYARPWGKSGGGVQARGHATS